MSEKNTVISGSADAAPVDETKDGSGPGVGELESGAIGSTTVKAKPRPKFEKTAKEKAAEPEVPKVAVYSNGPLHWDIVGELKRGYNFVTEEAANQWITQPSVRLATPEEVAKEFAE